MLVRQCLQWDANSRKSYNLVIKINFISVPLVYRSIKVLYKTKIFYNLDIFQLPYLIRSCQLYFYSVS